jgi:hypothetical protein
MSGNWALVSGPPASPRSTECTGWRFFAIHSEFSSTMMGKPCQFAIVNMADVSQESTSNRSVTTYLLNCDSQTLNTVRHVSTPSNTANVSSYSLAASLSMLNIWHGRVWDGLGVDHGLYCGHDQKRPAQSCSTSSRGPSRQRLIHHATEGLGWLGLLLS